MHRQRQALRFQALNGFVGPRFRRLRKPEPGLAGLRPSMQAREKIHPLAASEPLLHPRENARVDELADVAAQATDLPNERRTQERV